MSALIFFSSPHATIEMAEAALGLPGRAANPLLQIL
jgi:hypothetical protein